MRMLTTTAIGAVVLVLSAVFGTRVLERRLMYFPDPERVSPESAGLAGVKEVTVATRDNERLVAWHAAPRTGEPTLLYFHGNAGGLVNRAERVQFFIEHGIGVFILGYRGYGGSSGVPSERANVADAEAAYEHLLGAGVAPRDIVIYGESLGTGIASQLAAKREARGLVLDAPYTSLVDVAERFYPYLPARLVMRDRYETLRYIDKVKAPVLVIHGELDQVIPLDMGRAVFAAAPEPKEFVSVPLAGHSDHHQFGSYDMLVNWLRTIAPGARDRVPGAER